jgi:ATP-binding cassette subfamily B protein
MTRGQRLSSLLGMFPALSRLGRPRRGHIPFVQQMEAAECGAACLAMVLAHYGRDVPLGEIREATGTDRDGVNALAILEAGRAHGLRGRGLKIEDVNDLQYLDPAAILHFEFNHFVVFSKFTRRGIEVLDPAVGRRHVPMDRLRKVFTGVALVFEPAEDFQPAARREKRVRHYLKQVFSYPGELTRVVVTSLLVQGFALALPLLTGVLVDRVVPRGDQHLLMVMGVGLAAIVAFNFLTSFVRSHLLLNLRTHLDAQLTLSFAEHLMGLPFGFFQKRSAGDLMMRLNSNAIVRDVLTSSTLSALLDGSMASLYLVIMFVVSPWMGLLVVALGALQAVLFVITRQRQKDLMTEELQAQARSQGYQVQMLVGIETLKAGGSEHRATEHWSNLFVDVLNISLSRGRLNALVDSLIATLRMASPLLILWFGGLLVLNGGLSLGTMLAISALAGGFLVPLSTLVGTAIQLTTLRSYIERIDDVLITPPEQERDKVVRARPLTGRVTLENVSFRYGPLAPLVVREVSADVAPGQQVAIVGRSGSGKSTLARLLVGLYPPTDGRVLYDGADLAGLDFRSVRSQLGLVTQTPFLFGTTIRDNILQANPGLPFDAVVQAARLAHIHDEIEAMPMRYDTLLTDGGQSLSGGQRQRIALARALVHKPRILVLDEATSDVDAVNERAIQISLRGLDCTAITIAHRLSTVVQADLILVMKDGLVVERGTHSELMGRGGEYAELVRAQTHPASES